MSLLTTEQVEHLEKIKGAGGCHASNILAKNKNQDKDIGLFIDKYLQFSKSLEGDLVLAVDALNRYKDYVHKHNVYTAQSKLDPSIIEEFLCRVLKHKFGNGVLQYGSVSAYSSLYFSYPDIKQGVEIKLNVKDQDVGIYKEEVLSINAGKEHRVSIPIVCIECKTYLDKTMYEGSVATATKIKTGNPYCQFFLVTETYDVSKNVDIKTTDIDNIYVLRKQRRRSNSPKNPIHVDVVKHLMDTIEARMRSQNMTVDDCISSLGYIRQ